jgi:hypothetical protein
VNTDVFAVLLVLLITLAVSTGTVMALLISRSRRLRPRVPHVIQLPPHANYSFDAQPAPFLNRPNSWLAIKSRNLVAVQSALGLHHVKPCSLLEGLSGQEKLFIAPPVKGWILVFGSGLPDPADDVDIFFRFIVNLSRKLGAVQFFTANRALAHHAWVRVESGRIVRAYAWAGRTLWQQGPQTPAETELDLHCFEYDDADTPTPFVFSDVMSANVDRVPLLAARWSLDPAGIDQHLLAREYGLAGEPSRSY